ARLRTVSCVFDITGHKSVPRRVGGRHSKVPGADITLFEHLVGAGETRAGDLRKLLAMCCRGTRSLGSPAAAPAP
ncbi:MAG: hypothetical protein ACJ8D4_21395, partial [Xanthobacteraceae bacterium]